MTESDAHPGDALQLLLDERLTPERRASVEAHLLGCARCHRELDALRRVRMAVRERLPDHEVPPALSARVAAALAQDPVTTADRSSRLVRLRWVAALGLSAAAVAVLAIALTRSGGRDPIAQAAHDFSGLESGRIALQVETADPQALARYFHGRIPFAVRVFDFGGMGYRLRGGGVHRIAGRAGALFAYEDAAGQWVVCQMFPGTLSELAIGVGAEEREHDGIRFRIYRSAGLTLVFWQEGSILCVLAADGDVEAAIQLAYAKAE